MSEILTFNTETGYSMKYEPSGIGLGKLIQNFQSPVALEIGSDSGETAQFLLEVNSGLILHSIDPYTDFTDWNGGFVNNREQMYQDVLKRFSSYGSRFIQYRQTSNEAVNQFQDNMFDLIFIDGLHTYDQVKFDCENYYSMMKDGGIFSGHDFDAIPAVRKAVVEFATKLGKEILKTNNDVWYWIK